MSQTGSTEPAAGSRNTSTTAPGSRPSALPLKPASDDEAEEGEILDEEEGEIPESRPSEPSVPAESTQSAPTNTEQTEQPSQAPQTQPTTPELPPSKLSVTAEKPSDATLASDVSTYPTDAVTADSGAPKGAKSGENNGDEVAPGSVATESVPTKDLTAQDGDDQLTAPAASAPVASATAPSEQLDQTRAEKRADHEEADTPGTPKLPETGIPGSEDAHADPLSKERQKEGASNEASQQRHEEMSENTSGPALEDVQARSTAIEQPPSAPRPEEPAAMEIDEKPESPKQSESPKKEASAEATPMQVDDSIETPAVLSDGAEVPAESGSKDGKENEKSSQETAAAPAQTNSEPQPESDEKPMSSAAKTTDTATQEPVDAQQHRAEEPMVEEQTDASQVQAATQPPAAGKDASPDPQAGEAAPPSMQTRSEDAHNLPAPGADASLAPSTIEPERRSKSSRKSTPATGPVQEKRLERPKERSRTAERSQDREQRAREKDRRREMERVERVERERERERERIRESERDREMMIARENEEARLIWLSLPGNDHPQYYTDTDTDSCYGAEGVLGAQVTDEEDKDLDPPLPLSLQVYHPAPSYSQAYFDDAYYASKRKRFDDADEDVSTMTRHSRRKPVSGPSASERIASSSSRPIPRDALPSTTMIDIDDFPVPDSSVRGEPSDRPFASRIERPSLPRISPYGQADDAAQDYESSDSDEEAMRIADERKRRRGNRGGNRGNKLSREKGVRWIRRGKLGGWTEMRMEKEIGDRVRHRVEAMQKDNVRALLSAMPEEDKAMLAQFPALRNGLIPSDAPSTARRDARGRILPSDLSEAARIDAELGLDGGFGASRLERPEHLTSTSLAPTLLKPAITPRQLLTSHTLRHTFRNPHIAALGKTALDLIESEGVVGRAVGRCWAAMERGGWNTDPEPKGDTAEEADSTAPNGMDVDGSDDESSVRRTSEGALNGSSSSIFGSAIDNPALSHLDKLFVTKQGLAIPRLDDMGQPIFVPPSPGTQAARTQAGMSEDAANEAVIETTLLPAPEQRSIVLAALECLHELAADSREYVERLEEVRSRLAAVKRRRAQVWNAVRQWALDKDIEASLAEGGNAERIGTLRPAAEAAGSVAAMTAVYTNGGSPRKRK